MFDLNDYQERAQKFEWTCCKLSMKLLTSFRLMCQATLGVNYISWRAEKETVCLLTIKMQSIEIREETISKDTLGKCKIFLNENENPHKSERTLTMK